MLVGEIPITALNYADSVAMLANSVEEKQHIIDAVERSARSTSLVHSMLKAEVILTACSRQRSSYLYQIQTVNVS